MITDGQVIREDGIELRVTGSNIIIAGTINSKTSRLILEPFFTEVNSFILANNFKEVLVDISDLKFLNSSGIRAIVAWVIKIGALPEDSKYVITFLCNPDYTWQESSISTLMFLNKNLVKKEFI